VAAPIPVVVSNGLCDCAARVRSLGGADEVIDGSYYRSSNRIGTTSKLRDGYDEDDDDSLAVRCADSPANCALRAASAVMPIEEELRDMQRTATEMLQQQEHERTVSTDPRWFRTLRFCRVVDDGGDGGRRCETLGNPNLLATAVGTLPLQKQRLEQPDSDNYINNKNPNNNNHYYHRDPIASRRNESFLETMDRAVRIASFDEGCDTLIVINHREGIRDLVELASASAADAAANGCGNHRYRYATPPCCIATFTAKVLRRDDGDAAGDRRLYQRRPLALPKSAVRWSCHGVFPYREFDASCIPSET